MRPKILVVDDDQAFRALIVPALERRGYEVLQARTLGAANNALRKCSPDLVVIDGLLPDGDGIRWIRALRARGQRTGVIFVSAFWRDTGTHRLLTHELGVLAVLHKPLDPRHLASEVSTHLPHLSLGAADELRGPLDSLRHEFLPALCTRLEKLAAICTSAKAHPEEVVLQAQAFSAAHTLFGTAGTYGFDEVSHALERLQDILRMPTPLAPGCWSLIELALGEARRAASGLTAELLPAPAEPAPGPGPALSATPEARILLLDADPHFISRASTVLRADGYRVFALSRPSHLFAGLEKTHPDLLLLDAGRLDGIDLCRRLRTREEWSTLPVVCVTCDDARERRCAAFAAGADDYLCKPIDDEELRVRVRCRIERFRALRGGAPLGTPPAALREQGEGLDASASRNTPPNHPTDPRGDLARP